MRIFDDDAAVKTFDCQFLNIPRYSAQIAESIPGLKDDFFLRISERATSIDLKADWKIVKDYFKKLSGEFFHFRL